MRVSDTEIKKKDKDKDKEKDKELENQKVSKADAYIRGYEESRKLLALNIYEKNTTSEWRESGKEGLGDTFFNRARMFDIRHKVMELPNGDEKLILYYHYIKGESIDRCADLLGLSRSTAFRIKRKGLVMLYDLMNK